MINTSITSDTYPSYNNCFVLGCKSKNKYGKLIKKPLYLNKNLFPDTLSGGKDGKLRHYYELTYEQAQQGVENYKAKKGNVLNENEKTLRVSLYLDNAMFGNLHIFVIDFDKVDGKVDTESPFFKAAMELADKVTRSQGGGYHMFYGINKEVATPLFDSINLLASKIAKSYISHTGAITLDNRNKVDFFCDAHHFIYEWEEWDNTIGLTDKTQELYELIKENFELKRPMDFDEWEAATDGWIELEGLPEYALHHQMTEKQQAVFDDLKENYSSDCTKQEWYRIGLDIYHVFGDELGGSVFLWWSKPGHSYNPSGCARTWSSICRKGPLTRMLNSDWDFAISAF